MLNFGPITSFEVSWPSLQVTRLLTLRVCTGGFCARPLLHHHEEHWHQNQNMDRRGDHPRYSDTPTQLLAATAYAPSVLNAPLSFSSLNAARHAKLFFRTRRKISAETRELGREASPPGATGYTITYSSQHAGRGQKIEHPETGAGL